MAELKQSLDALYRRYNRRAFVHPDPLEFLYRYMAPGDQEIVGLISATLAYGRVAQILTSIERVLAVMGGSPCAFLETTAPAALGRAFRGFKHRFTTGEEMAFLLTGVKRALRKHGSLETLFRDGMGGRDETVLPGLTLFVERLRGFAGGPCPSLLSSPADGSACKRLNLWLRWMVRKDAVDPGPWKSVSRTLLVVPLDTHLFRMAGRLGLTTRKQADLKTAVEVTRAFARLRPDDPVRYDFSLTRLGINPACRDSDLACLLEERDPSIASTERRAGSN
jgi:uncharacterized protein (TIGR02757 family)